MRLIHTTTMEMREFYDSKIPHYAILSHCWGEEEISFDRYQQPDRERLQGYRKVASFADIAKSQYDLDWAWVDTCCIDKRSSSELSEAINAMYNYYKKADICVVFLADVNATSSGLVVEWHEQLEQQLVLSRWFRRGFTLQELIAPRRVVFYSSSWHIIGIKNSNESSWRYIKSLETQTWREAAANFEKYSRRGPYGPWKVTVFSDLLARVTKIPQEVLHIPWALSKCSVAQKLSWMDRRYTSREEDLSYCLFGILQVNLPLLYGEGGDRAWLRLQQEIVRTTSDESIFAWSACTDLIIGPDLASRGVLAASIRDFHSDVTIFDSHRDDSDPLTDNDYYYTIRSITAFARPTYMIGNQGLELKILANTAIVVERIGWSYLFIPLNCSTSENGVPILLKLREERCGHYERDSLIVDYDHRRLEHEYGERFSLDRPDVEQPHLFALDILAEDKDIVVHVSKEAAEQCRAKTGDVYGTDPRYVEGIQTVIAHPADTFGEHCTVM